MNRAAGFGRVQLAVDLDALDRTDEAKKKLDHVIPQRGKVTIGL